MLRTSTSTTNDKVQTMNKRNATLLGLAAMLAVAGFSTTSQAQETVHDRARGELSPGTGAPTQAQLMNAIRSAAPTALEAMLEYGERVECHACVPLLEQKLLEDSNAETRRISAWWLRHRPFAIAAIMNRMKAVLATDADATRRARAASAIGEFLDAGGLTPLVTAFETDGEPVVREAVIRALGRLNHPGGNATIAAGLGDTSNEVRRAALDQVLLVNFFREDDALMSTLGDDDAYIRMRSARLLGAKRVAEAVPALAGMLRSDSDNLVRQAAAWALGRIGGADARAALREAGTIEEVSIVRDAINVAIQMR
jgi:hypothetical protein